MQTIAHSNHQTDLYQLMRGVAGGRALRDKYGTDYMAQLGRAGGRATVARYGRSYMATLGERGRAARRLRRDTLPITIRHWDGYLYRRIPFWPAPGTMFYSRRRRRPILIWIELEGGTDGA